MRIEKLELKNFRGFEDLTINFPENNNVAVFIGKNGSGKSSILDAIWMSIPLSIQNRFRINLDDSIGSEDVKRGSEFTRIITKFSNSEEPIKSFWSNTSNSSFDPDYEIQEFNLKDFEDVFGFNYPDTRNFILFDSSIDYKEFLNWFVDKENLENQEKINQKKWDFELSELKVVRSAIKNFLAEMEYERLNGIRVIRVENKKKIESKENADLEIKEPISSWGSNINTSLVIDKGDEVFSLSQLASGEKSILLLVADIAHKLTDKDPIKNQNALDKHGFILIDEIQMHLHPNWQRKILPALTKTFPNVQFIVTTHSPQVVSSLNKESIFILEDFKLVENTPFTKGRDANSILSEVFGVPKWTDDIKEKINKLYKLIDDEKKEEALGALKEIEQDFGPDDLELVRANMYLDLMEDEDEVHIEK